jgi:hypothetical protein
MLFMLRFKYQKRERLYLEFERGEVFTMTMVTQDAIKKGYEKMLKLPQEQITLLLGIIDQFSATPSLPSSTVKLGIADGKYHIPDDINQYDEQIEKLFGI